MRKAHVSHKLGYDGIAPAGLRDPAHPAPDLLRIPPEDLAGMLVTARWAAPIPTASVRTFPPPAISSSTSPRDHGRGRRVLRLIRRHGLPL